MALAPGTRLGAYEVVGLLGAGGMGEVYRAWDRRLERDVAVKVLPLHLTYDPVARERLHREARAAAALDHPFICKIFEIGEHNDTLFIVMEHVVGETLHARLVSGLPTPSEALRIAGEIVDALEAAHARRIVHRDLKPGNVMLTVQGHVKVMDFGLAKQVSAVEQREAATTAIVPSPRPVTPLTDPGLRVGTPDYMAPEQVLGDAVDERADLFAFGILLCELLTGTHPFRRRSPGETMAAILREPPTLASSKAGPLPESVAALLRLLLAKAPADRFTSSADVRHDLSRLASSLSSTTLSALVPEHPTVRTMVGRDAEQTELRRRLEDTIAGRGSIVLVGGEPGIGKTRLTQALVADARQRGCFAVVGHCYEGEGAPPYIPFVETLEYSARVVAPSTFRHALGDAAPEVAKLMPELRQLFPDIPAPIQLPPEQQRRFLFNAYREFLERCCGFSPLVVVLEDLHWADEPTLQLLQHLAQTVGTTALLVVGTYRDVELDAERPFAQTLERLLRERLATRIPLHRLPSSGVEAMLHSLSGQPPPSSLSRAVFQETEGNPFFVEEVFHHLAEDGRLFDAEGGWRSDLRVDTLQVPEGVRLVIGRRLRRLSEVGRRVLTTAAVVGRTFSAALLEELEPTQSEVVLDALEDAERAQLVVAQSSGREPRYRFTHELIRQTLADGLSLPRRQRLHARIAAAIERVYAPSLEKQASVLAHHLYQAGTAADVDKTISYLTLASDQAREAAAHEESLALVDQALSLWEGDTGRHVRDLHARRAGALRSLGQTGEAVAAYERAMMLFDEAGDVENLAVTAIELAALQAWNARIDESTRVTDRALERLGSGAPALRCRLLLRRAGTLGASGNVNGALAALTEARALQETLGDPALACYAAVMETRVWYYAARPDRSVEAYRDALQQCRALGDLWSEAEIAHTNVLSSIMCGRPAHAMRLIEERVPLAEHLGHHSLMWALKAARALEALYRGQLEAAESGGRQSLAFGQAVQTGWHYLDCLALGLIGTFQGRPREATVHLQQAIDSEPKTVGLRIAVPTFAWALAHEGDVSGADDLLGARPLQLPERGQIQNGGELSSLVILIETLALLGRRDEAAPLHVWADDLVATGIHCPYWSATMVATAAGVAAACAKEWSRAEAHHQRAIQQADAAYRICQPDARAWYADMLLERGAAGDSARARFLLSEALALYESIGMPNFARRTSARLATVQ